MADSTVPISCDARLWGGQRNLVAVSDEAAQLTLPPLGRPGGRGARCASDRLNSTCRTWRSCRTLCARGRVTCFAEGRLLIRHKSNHGWRLRWKGRAIEGSHRRCVAWHCPQVRSHPKTRGEPPCRTLKLGEERETSPMSSMRRRWQEPECAGASIVRAESPVFTQQGTRVSVANVRVANVSAVAINLLPPTKHGVSFFWGGRVDGEWRGLGSRASAFVQSCLYCRGCFGLWRMGGATGSGRAKS